MNSEHVERQISELVQAVDLCFNNGLIVPGLMLLYAGIDAMAWLCKRREADSVGDAFQRWVKTYLLRPGDTEGGYA